MEIGLQSSHPPSMGGKLSILTDRSNSFITTLDEKAHNLTNQPTYACFFGCHLFRNCYNLINLCISMSQIAINKLHQTIGMDKFFLLVFGIHILTLPM
jgi:hypothetical protein